ncbi:MAG: DUF4159 domain-containing protein [Planctomycetota bacterium]|nr:MAG: DUF4159 domain-containing protein [Planctomycetota bacterium]REK33486.1 MAG: DUF4159 domain-containing protein [Planctomycetota bacterium]
MVLKPAAAHDPKERAMQRIPGVLLVTAACLASACSRPVSAQEMDDAELREGVLASIERAQQFLISRQLGNGSWQPSIVAKWEAGVSSLAVLALLNSGLPADHPAVAKGLDHLRRRNIPDQTYELAMMIMAFSAAGDPRDDGRIGTLADRLASYQHSTNNRDGVGKGAWGYGSEEGWWDNSNTQFALLGLREAAYAGIPVDEQVWRLAQEHWMRPQGGPRPIPAGGEFSNGWVYTGGRSAQGSGSMTVAGVAALTITSDFLRSGDGEGPQGITDCCEVDPQDAEVRQVIDGGIRWLSQHFQVRSNPGAGAWLLYYLYGLERAGRLTGTRFFGDHDWYREGARHLVSHQDIRSGSWVSQNEQDPVVGTSLALLFLSKGLSPVLINKIQFGPRRSDDGAPDASFWNVHPRDVSHLTTYISGREGWPRLVTWQSLDLEVAAREEGVAALLQAPVQYMSGAQDPGVLSDEEVNLLREYISQGGFLFAVQGCGSVDFDIGFRELITRMFPAGEFQLERLPATHDVYRSEFVWEADENAPELWGVDVGCRTAIIYAPYDHACRWDRWMRIDPPRRPAAVKLEIAKSMQVGVNVVAYATGRELADKLRTQSVVDLEEDDPLNRGRTTIARIRHTGGFDTAPNALQHLKLALEEHGIDLSPLSPTIPTTDPTLFDYAMVYMHGRKNFALTEEERDKLRAYLENGGFLFADACCGARQFDDSFRKLVEQIFGRPLERIPVEHELFNNPLANDIREVRRRIPQADGNEALTLQESVGEPVLEGIQIDGRYAIIYSKYDLSCALQRQATVACAGYPTEDAAKIGVNIVLYGLIQ